MARSWKRIRQEAADAGLVDEQLVENARTDMQSTIHAYKLAEVRKDHHVNQTELARRMKVSQSRVSAIEKNPLRRTELGTIQAYVESLGGTVRIIADFGDTSVTVTD